MNTNAWLLSSWICAIVLAVCLLMTAMQNRQPKFIGEIVISPFEYFCGISLILIGVFLRLWFTGELFEGRLTSDENIISVVYVSTVINREFSLHGATELAYALLLDFWYSHFGFTALSARTCIGILNLAGLLFNFFGVKSVTNSRIALWSTAFLSTSLYAIYFSKLAIDPGWVLFAYPTLLCLLVLSVRAKSIFGMLLTGLIFSLCVFSYPGFLFSLLGIFISGAVFAVFSIKCRNDIASFVVEHRRLIAFFAVGSVPFAVFAIWQHIYYLGLNGQTFMVGGGSVSINAIKLDDVYALLQDIFIEANSWYLPFRGRTFFEFSLIPLVIWAIFLVFKLNCKWPWKVLVISVPVCVFLVLFTGAYPGMRRAIYVIFPLSIFLGFGMDFLIRLTPMSKKLKIACLIGLGISVAEPIAYQFTTGRDIAKWNFGDGFGHQKITDEFLIGKLKLYNVFLEESEFSGGWFDIPLYKETPRLLRKYRPELSSLHNVIVVANQDFLTKGISSASDAAVFVTFSPSKYLRYVRDGKVCLSMTSVDFSTTVKSPYWGLIPNPEKGCAGASMTIAKPGLKSSLRFDPLQRLIIELDCNAAGCGADRPNYIYTGGGSVRFNLNSRELGGSDLALKFEVVNAHANRDALIYANGIFLGHLMDNMLDADKHVALFRLPDKSLRADFDWNIEIRPAPSENVEGWDITHVEIIKGIDKSKNP